MRSGGLGRIAIYTWVYALPVPLAVGMYFVWRHYTSHVGFALYVSLVPLFYGYISPGIATNVLHRWRFKGPGVIGSYYLHHGFMYAANMSPLLFLAMAGQGLDPLTIGSWVRISLVAGGLHGFVLWIHDILLVRNDMVEIYNRPAREGRSAEEIVAYYAPLCFFLIGASYAAGSLFAYQQLVLKGQEDGGAIALTWAIASAPLFVVPGIAYFFLDRSR